MSDEKLNQIINSYFDGYADLEYSGNIEAMKDVAREYAESILMAMPKVNVSHNADYSIWYAAENGEFVWTQRESSGSGVRSLIDYITKE